MGAATAAMAALPGSAWPEALARLASLPQADVVAHNAALAVLVRGQVQPQPFLEYMSPCGTRSQNPLMVPMQPQMRVAQKTTKKTYSMTPCSMNTLQSTTAPLNARQLHRALEVPVTCPPRRGPVSGGVRGARRDLLPGEVPMAAAPGHRGHTIYKSV